MEYHNVEFIKSVGNNLDYPESNLKEVVLAGRSNVGKSSFINTICNRKNLCFVGKTPGKTRLINFFEVDKRFMLVDVPGYGYVKDNSSQMLLDFGYTMEDYFNRRDKIYALFMIVDLRHKPTNDDIHMIEFAKSKHLNIYVIATKMDKVKNKDIIKNKKLIAETLNVDVNSIILFSSITRKGYDEVWNILNQIN